MNRALAKVLRDKNEGRAAMADRPVTEKLALLEKLRARRQSIAATSIRIGTARRDTKSRK